MTRLKNLLAAALLLLWVAASHAQVSGTFTVGPGATYETLADAFTGLSSAGGLGGDVILELQADYTASDFTTLTSISGYQTYSITIQPASDATSIEIDNDFRLNHFQNVVFDGANPSTGDKVVQFNGEIRMFGNTNNVTFKSLMINVQGPYGIYGSNAGGVSGTPFWDDITIMDCEFFAETAIDYGGSIYAIFSNATTGAPSSRPNNIVVQDNKFYGLNRTNTTGLVGAVFVNTGLKAYNNSISHEFSGFENRFNGLFSNYDDNNEAINNTIHVSGGNTSTTASVSAISYSSGTSGGKVINNIVNITSSGDASSDKRGINTNKLTHTLAYNNVYVLDDGVSDAFFINSFDETGSLDYSLTLAVSNPSFSNPSTGDLSLSGSSLTNPDFRSFFATSVVTDHNGDPKNSTVPSKGAFEVVNMIADITAFDHPNKYEDAVIDRDNSTVLLEVTTGTDITNIAPLVGVYFGGSVNPTSSTARNFSSPKVYTVTAQDGSTTDDWTASVVLQNDAPTDISLSTMSIDENNSLADVIGVFSSTDADAGDSHSYELVAGTGSDDNGDFSINIDELEADVVFDYETKNSYTIRVRSDDNVAHGGTFDKVFSISINDLPDEAPTAINLDNTSVVEGAPIGTTVGNLSTVDIDVADDHVYTLVSGSGDSGNSFFDIDGDELVTVQSLDFSEATSYSVLIRTTDNGDAFYEQSFIINIEEVTDGPQGTASSDEFKVVPTTRYSFDNFGEDVAISNGHAIIGGRNNNYDVNEENFVRDAGAAYFYEKDGTGKWAQTQKIVEPIRNSFNSFGEVLAMDGNYAAVGVTRASDPSTGFSDGLVYIYERDASGVWNYTQTLSASGSVDEGIEFGYAVDISGDYLVASALYDPFDENGENSISDAGAAYIFERDGTGVWQEVQKIVASDRANQIFYFGETVSISGNYVAVGAPEAASLADDGITLLEQSGAVYVYERNGSGVWNEVTKAVASDREASDYMGYAIDVDGETLAIGNENKGIAGGEDQEGAVYIFKRSSGGLWEEDAILTPGIRFTEQGFGRSVRLSDGNLAVGGNFDVVNTFYGIFLFTQSADGWIESDIVAPFAYENSTQFGETIDLDGKELIVGEQYANYDAEGGNSLSNAGAAYFFELCSNPDLPTIVASSELACANSSVNLSVGDASLNDATSWEWYAGSCEGTFVGSGASITVNPTVTTTYYVRGEGACTNTTTCSFITIEVYDECPFNDILTFSIPNEVQPAVIDDAAHTVDVLVPAGTNPTGLIPTFTISDEATVSPESGVAQNFSSNIIYTVTAIDGTEQEWEVEVEEEAAAPTDIILSSTTADENSVAGTVVAELTAVDANFTDSFTFSTLADPEFDDYFTIPGGGSQLVIGSSPLDFETKSSFNITIIVTDNTLNTFQKEFTITVNDVNEQPTALDLSSRDIDESSPIGTVVGILSTTDVDAGDTHTYSYTAGCDVCDPVSEEQPFLIVGNELRSNIIFDYETQNGYAIEVTSTDAGGLSIAESFVITINDLPAQVTSLDLSNESINENENTGTVVGTFSTTGEDLSGNYTYTLVSGVGDTDNSSFSVSGDQLLTSTSFDFETKSSYSIRVMTNDGLLTREESFTIAVNNISEAPTDLSLSETSIAENNAVNVVIGSLTTSDEDAGESYTYSLVVGTGDADNASFNINGNELRATDVFDFETKNSYSVRVETNDGNGGRFEKAFTIAITNQNESISIANPIADQALEEGFANLDIDLTDVFNDEDGDPLTYEVSSSNTSVVIVASTGSTLTISEVGLGTATISVTANDGSGVTTSDQFEVTISEIPLGLEDEISLDVYPNPTTSILNIRSNEVLKIDLSDVNGRRLKAATGTAVQMDLRDLSSGVYLLKITSEKSTTIRRIIKAN